jgi:hypothetical protein
MRRPPADGEREGSWGLPQRSGRGKRCIRIRMPTHADGACRRRIPRAHADACRRRMSTAHADGACRRRMPTAHADGACRRMPTAHADGACRGLSRLGTERPAASRTSRRTSRARSSSERGHTVGACRRAHRFGACRRTTRAERRSDAGRHRSSSCEGRRRTKPGSGRCSGFVTKAWFHWRLCAPKPSCSPKGVAPRAGNGVIALRDSLTPCCQHRVCACAQTRECTRAISLKKYTAFHHETWSQSSANGSRSIAADLPGTAAMRRAAPRASPRRRLGPSQIDEGGRERGPCICARLRWSLPARSAVKTA